jgi:hypothetical protein
MLGVADHHPQDIFGLYIPGVAGEELVDLLNSVDFSKNQSAYTPAGRMSRLWLAKYVDGVFYERKQFICVYEQP